MFTAWGKLATLNKEQKISTAQLALPTFHSEPTWVSAGAFAVLSCKDTGALSLLHCGVDSLSRMEVGRLGVGRSCPIRGAGAINLCTPGPVLVCDTRRYLGTLSDDG